MSMRRTQICPNCGCTIKRNLVDLVILSYAHHFKKVERKPFQQILQCPNCKAYMMSKPLNIVHRIFFSLLLLTALFITIFQSLSDAETRISLLAYLSIPLYLLIVLLIRVFLLCVPSKKQSLLLCNDDGQTIHYKATHHAIVHQADSKYANELITGNILQLRWKDKKAYILIKKIQNDFCEFHYIPYSSYIEMEKIVEATVFDGEYTIADFINIECEAE